MSKKILLKRSNQTLSDGKPKLPTADQVDFGEVAVNYAAGVEALATKNSNGEIVTFTNEVKIGNETPSNGSMAKLFINETNSSVQYHSSNGWKTIETGGGGESVNVVQSTGTSTTSVMSQNAVTTELDKKANTSHTHTASQVSDLATVATSGSYNDLSNKPTVDAALSSSSTNPVQNKVINTALAGKANSSHVHAIGDITNLQTTLNGKANSSDVYTKTETNNTFLSKTDASTTYATKTELSQVEYTLPTATSSTLGGIKVGSGLSISGDGTLSATGGGTADSVSWDNITGKPSTFTPSSHTHDVATTSENGFMSSTDKTKLDGIHTNATQVTFSQTQTSGTAIGTININGTATTLFAPTAGEPVTYGNATSIVSGLVKLGSDTVQNVAANGVTSTASRTYAIQNNSNGQMVVNVPWTDTNTTYPVATTSANGLMSASDKSKLDNIESGATNITVDSALSSSSTNPVQNKVINTALSGKANTSHTHNISDISSLQTTLNNYVTDSDVDAKIAALVDSAPSTLDTLNELAEALGNDPNFATTISNQIGNKADKTELNNYATKTELTNATVVDSTLSSSSTNPVQNKVINTALAGKANSSHTHTASQVSELATVATSGSYNDLTNKPTIPSAYVLPQSTSSALGGIKIGYTESGKNYPVELNSSGQAYVNVPWTDNNTTYVAGTGLSLTGNTFSVKTGYTTTGKNYAVKATAAGLYVNVPWTDTNTTYPVATTSANGLMSSTDKSYVNSLYSSAFIGFSSTSGDGNVVLNNASGSCTIRFKSLGNDRVNECTIPAASQSSPGLMSSADKKKVDGLSDTTYIAYRNKSNVWTAYQDFSEGAGNSGSDMRFKENVRAVENILDQVLDIDVISYTWNKDGETKRDTFGVNADSLKDMGGVFSKIVHERDDEAKTKWVEYDRIGVLVLEAFKEYVTKTNKKIKELEEKLQIIKNK